MHFLKSEEVIFRDFGDFVGFGFEHFAFIALSDVVIHALCADTLSIKLKPPSSLPHSPIGDEIIPTSFSFPDLPIVAGPKTN